jgi:hypothetical protein
VDVGGLAILHPVQVDPELLEIEAEELASPSRHRTKGQESLWKNAVKQGTWYS